MQRVRIDYADQNDNFRTMLPRRGRVVRALPEISTGRPWTLIKLDEPFEWQHNIGEPFPFRLLEVDHLLVSPRWVGVEIGGPEPALVYVNLVERYCVPSGAVLDIREYVGVAWGWCHTEG